MMAQLGFVAAGGALGAVLRFVLQTAVAGALGREFPYGTLLVNVTGSLLIGVLYVVFAERAIGGDHWRAFLVVGLLGALTTFSTFSIETIELLESGAALRALVNVVLSVVLCLAACWAGVLAARAL